MVHLIAPHTKADSSVRFLLLIRGNVSPEAMSTIAVIRRLTQEPLLHFGVLGAGLFGAYTMVRPMSSEASSIVVSRDRIVALSAQFRGTWQRPPTREELQALIESYVREVLFYREGLALGLDRDDLIVLNGVKQKMEVLV